MHAEGEHSMKGWIIMKQNIKYGVHFIHSYHDLIVKKGFGTRDSYSGVKPGGSVTRRLTSTTILSYFGFIF